MGAYEFSKDWFTPNVMAWTGLFLHYKPRTYLEIGSYEGRSAVTAAEMMGGDAQITCLDVWHDPEIEQQFDLNVEHATDRNRDLSITKIKGRSFDTLKTLTGDFDAIYIDGSHAIDDVLADSVLAFELLKVGGIMIFDDYLWPHNAMPVDRVFDTPKAAIDAFVNCYRKRLVFLPGLPAAQLCIEKI